MAVDRSQAEQIEALASVKLSFRWGLGRELRVLSNRLLAGEQPLDLSSARYEDAYGLVACTDQRVMFLKAGWLSTRFEDFSYDKITSVQTATGLVFGSLVLHVSDTRAKLSAMFANQARQLGDTIRRQITAARRSSDVPRRIRRLGELRDEGLLTEEEFQAEKRALLEG